MKFRKINKALSDVRNNIRATGKVSEADRVKLESLLQQKITVAKEEIERTLPHKIMGRIDRPRNDNVPLTAEQRFKLRLMEKTGTGSNAVH